jgi:hypothetical protein
MTSVRKVLIMVSRQNDGSRNKIEEILAGERKHSQFLQLLDSRNWKDFIER